MATQGRGSAVAGVCAARVRHCLYPTSLHYFMHDFMHAAAGTRAVVEGSVMHWGREGKAATSARGQCGHAAARGSWSTQGRGSALHKDRKERQCLAYAGSGTHTAEAVPCMGTARKGSAFGTRAVECVLQKDRKERHCLRYEGSGTHRVEAVPCTKTARKGTAFGNEGSGTHRAEAVPA